MKKCLVVMVVAMGIGLVAGPPPPHHHHHGRGGVGLAADIVSIVANGVVIANGLQYQQPVYVAPAPQPVYYQGGYYYQQQVQPVQYVAPPVQYVAPPPQVQYVTVPRPTTVVVRERRPFILTRIIDAILP